MSDSTEQKELIQSWLDVNPGSESQARFYLEANNWDLNAALSNFYEQPPLSEGLPATSQGDASLPLDPNLVVTSPDLNLAAVAPVISAGPIEEVTAAPLASGTPAAAVPRRRHGSGARIATLSSLGGQDNEDNNGEKEWYAGGERSGMAVRPPPKNNGDEQGDSLVDQIMRHAAENSAAAGSSAMENHGNAGNAGTSRPSYFSGQGRALGSPSDLPSSSSSPTGNPAAALRESGNVGGVDDSGEQSENDEGDVAMRELTFWRNGFSIGDGPLYNIEDPINRQNLDAILQGRAPLDVLNVRPGQHVEMKVTDRRGEDYVPPAQPPAQPFSGHGHRLGGVSPTAAATAVDVAASTTVGRDITLDPQQRTVQVQIRLADGSRLVAKVNPSHTVGDLRAYVLSQRPEAGSRPFAFKAIMPPKVLSDDSATVEDTGIANAAIAQYFF
ncbi:protein phosphatase regulator [Coemansia sp. RSA 2703]|nr:protein phosphatase regulator [Coemansia sp. RSA 2703]KAJ2379275.1 protein phosphatase regulator [Coemansia sp. RSA 2607]KAJ2397966.1 protein phosphatase regulator [Coemansia sp. RSA 2603]